MSISFNSIEELKELMTEVFRDIIDEEANLATSDPAPAPADRIGLLSVADFFFGAGEFMSILDEKLANVDYTLDTARVYWTISDLITSAAEYGWLKSDEWEPLAELFNIRGGELADPNEDAHKLPDVGGDMVSWSNYLNLAMRYWDPPKGAFTGRDAPSADDAPFHEKIARIRKMIVFMRYHGLVDGSWPWYKKITNDLDALYKTHRPDPVTGEMPPISYAGG